MWNRFWAQNAIPHQTSARMTHLKVCMIIICCLDSTLYFNVFITTHIVALVRLWKGGTMFEQLGGTKMTVWQPFIPTWMAKSGEPFPGNLKVWMSKRVHFRSLFPKLAKNYSCYEGEYWHWINECSTFYVTNYINIIHSNVVSVMMSVWSCLIFTFALLKKWNCAEDDIRFWGTVLRFLTQYL